MTDPKRTLPDAKGLVMSLEALATVGKTKRKERPLSESLEEWRGKPLDVSPALRAQISAGQKEMANLGDNDDV